MCNAQPTLILASASSIRRQMLLAAGVAVTVDAADIDEAAAKARLRGELLQPTVPELARGLAALKAEAVSRRRPDDLVIGADQMLALDGDILSKAPDRAGAKAVLQRLRGKTHHLHSGAALARGGHAVWSHVGTATLHVRKFSDAWLESYLGANGEALTTSVGAYQLEGQGIQLFEHIEGDYFTILGLPLLPLLEELRRQNIIAE